MSEEPKISIAGPYTESDDGGTTNLESGNDLNLYLVQEARISSETDTEAQSIVGNDDDETLLAGFTGRSDVNYDGSLNGIRLFNAGMGEDPVDALINYLYELEALVQAEQGLGYAVQDSMRDYTVEPTGSSPGILFEEVTWTYEAGMGTIGEYNVDGLVNEGVQTPRLRSDYVEKQQERRDPTIQNDILSTEDATVEISDIETRRYSREVDFESTDILHNADVPVLGVADSGVSGEYYFEGRLTGHDDINLNSSINALLGSGIQGQPVTFRDSFSKREFSGIVSEANTTALAGFSDYYELDITIDIGQKITDIT